MRARSERPGLCLFRRLTGAYCPTCGLTRATLALVRGDIRRAHRFHPLVLVPPAVALSALCNGRDEQLESYQRAVVGALFVVWLWRMSHGTIPRPFGRA